MFPFACPSVLSAPHPPRETSYAPSISPEADPVPHSPPELNIGVVVFPIPKGDRAEAILDGRGRWRCPKLPVLDRVLNILHGPGRASGGDMPFGHAELVRVAAWLKGEVRTGR